VLFQLYCFTDKTTAHERIVFGFEFTRSTMVKEEQRGRGIAAMGRVARDEDGFTVYSTADVPEAFRVWHEDGIGERCTCDRFNRAFRAGRDYRCEHIVAVELWLDPPEDVLVPVPLAPEEFPPLRRVV
jgi:hypothetical protein